MLPLDGVEVSVALAQCHNWYYCVDLMYCFDFTARQSALC